MRLSLGTMCRLRVTTKTLECVSRVVSMPPIRYTESLVKVLLTRTVSASAKI
jgi:hypothetical protein